MKGVEYEEDEEDDDMEEDEEMEMQLQELIQATIRSLSGILMISIKKMMVQSTEK